jgi:acyl carrier protein
MVDIDEIGQRVKRVTAETLKVELSRVASDSRFVEDLGASSMESVELVAAYEEEFDINMDEQAALAVKTVGDAVAFIAKILGA